VLYSFAPRVSRSRVCECVLFPKTGILLPGVTFWGLVRDESHADDGHKKTKAGHSGAVGKDAERRGRAGDFFVRLLASSAKE